MSSTLATTREEGVLHERVEQARRRLAPLVAEYPFEPHFFPQPWLEHPERELLQHFVDEGPHSAPPVLFVHGNPTWSFAWRRSIRALRGDYRCIAPDHIGCGLSDKPQAYAYRLEQHVTNLERLVLDLDLSNITLVVHDWGGPIGFGFARRHPGRIARLVVTNTGAFPVERMPWRLAVCRVPLFGTLAIRGFNAFARAATLMATEKPLSPEARRGYLLPYDSWSNRVATLRFVEDIPMSPEHPSFAELRAIEKALPLFREKPMALLWGECDWCFSPTFRREWERRFPAARVQLFQHAGHYLFEDAAEGVVDAIQEFLRSPEAPPQA